MPGPTGLNFVQTHQPAEQHLVSDSIKTVRKKIDIELYPIIRIRGGDFLFSEEEFEIMLHDVESCKSAGCDGIVFGMLIAGWPDRSKPMSARLIEKAYPMGVCFHRAFDWTRNPFEALEEIIELDVKEYSRPVSSPLPCWVHHLIRDLISTGDDRITDHARFRSAGMQIFLDLKNETGATEFHSSARILRKSSMEYIQPFMTGRPINYYSGPAGR